MSLLDAFMAVVTILVMLLVVGVGAVTVIGPFLYADGWRPRRWWVWVVAAAIAMTSATLIIWAASTFVNPMIVRWLV